MKKRRRPQWPGAVGGAAGCGSLAPAKNRALRPSGRAVSSLQFDLSRAHAEAPAGYQREHVAVDPRRRRTLPALGQDAEPPREPASLAAGVAGPVVLDAPAADRDLAHAEA